MTKKRTMLRIVMTVYFLSISVLADSNFTKFNAYLDIEEQQYVSVFSYTDEEIKNPNHQMENWKTCHTILDPKNPQNKICKNAVGWLPRDATIEVIKGREFLWTRDPRTNELIREEYNKVYFEYWYDVKDEKGQVVSRKLKTGQGYIPTAYLSKQDRSAFYATKNKEGSMSKQVCDKQGKCYDAALAKPNDPIADLIQNQMAKDHVNNLSIVSTADRIESWVGECKKIDKKTLEGIHSNANTYDHFLLSDLQKKIAANKNSPSFQEIKKELGEDITETQIVEIDALARTMYGEMGRCYRKGLQYPMAVARIVANRSIATCALKNGVFIQGAHNPTKSDLAKAATSPRQFNLWLKAEGLSNKGPLNQALCPPKAKGQKFYTGTLPADSELAIWKNSVRIATETVLYPKRFALRTEQLEARYYYSSGLGKFYNLEQVYPQIEGRRLDDNNCMEVWRNLAKDQLCNGGHKSKFDQENPPGKKKNTN